MTPDKVKMTCEDVDKKLKNFLGDLLSDEDYQGFVEHLDGCTKCGKRVRMMGSFTNQLWELGDIEIPSDLDSTIIFQYDQAKKAPPKPKPKMKKSKMLGIAVVVVVVGIGIAFGAKKFFKPAELNGDQERGEAVTVQATAFTKKVSAPDPEAERLYKQLKSMAESLAPATQHATKKKDPEPEPQKEETIVREASPPPVKKPVRSAPKSSPDAYSLHWHLPQFSESDAKQLVSTITMLDIDPDYDDQNFIVFRTTNKKIKTLSIGIKFTYKLQLDVPEFIMDGSDPQGEVAASISFTGRETTYSTAGTRGGALSSFEQEENAAGNIFDWHVLLVLSQQNALIDVIHRHRGTVLFTSNEAVIFSIPGARIKALSEEIQGTGGMFTDLMGSDFETASLLGIVNVLIYLPEQ